MPDVSSQNVRNPPVILRPVPGDAVEGINASQPHLSVWLAILELRAELARCLNEAISELPLSVDLELILRRLQIVSEPLSVNIVLVLRRSQIARREQKPCEEGRTASRLNDRSPDLDAIVCFVLQKLHLELCALVKLEIWLSSDLSTQVGRLPRWVPRYAKCGNQGKKGKKACQQDQGRYYQIFRGQLPTNRSSCVDGTLILATSAPDGKGRSVCFKAPVNGCS